MLKQKMETDRSGDSAAPTRGLVPTGKRHPTNATAAQKQGQRPARPEHWTPRPPQPKRNAAGSEFTGDHGLGALKKCVKRKRGLENSLGIYRKRVGEASGQTGRKKPQRSPLWWPFSSGARGGQVCRGEVEALGRGVLGWGLSPALACGR